MKIQLLPPDKLIPWGRNPRVNDHAVERVAAGIQRNGFNQPIVCDQHFRICVGHTRWKAAQFLGLKEVPVFQKEMTEKQFKDYNISDNKLGELADWDKDGLKEIVLELKKENLDLEVLGFSIDEIEEMTTFHHPGKTEEDLIPEIKAKAVSRRGDIWLLGEHRLMCGDAIDGTSVSRLMNGECASLLQTDPPYGIAYVANAKSKGQSITHEDIENDELDGEKLQSFLEKMIKSAIPHLIKNAAFYLWHPMLTQGTFFAAAAAAAADILIHRQIIWVKPSLVFGRGDYHWRHELCFYGWVKGNRPAFYGPRNQTTIWEIGRETQKEHPTAKPVDIWKAPIENHTRQKELCYEPFAGSGSQIIACEKLNRRCNAMEISENYCDVIIHRWQNYTGKQAVLDSTKETYNVLSNLRSNKEEKETQNEKVNS